MNSRSIAARDKIIVALDVSRKEAALDLVRQLAGQISFFKIGLQLYTAEGPQIVRAVLGTGAKVVLDLKLDDIRKTVARAGRSTAEVGVRLLTVHWCGVAAMRREVGAVS